MADAVLARELMSAIAEAMKLPRNITRMQLDLQPDEVAILTVDFLVPQAVCDAIAASAATFEVARRELGTEGTPPGRPSAPAAQEVA